MAPSPTKNNAGTENATAAREEAPSSPTGTWRHPHPIGVTSGLFAVAAGAIGALAVYGWHNDTVLLVHVFKGYPPLSHAGGLCLCLIFLAHMALLAGRRFAAAAIALFTIVGGLLSIADSLGDLAPALEPLRLPQFISPAGKYSGPMGLSTAFALTLAGATVLLLSRERRPHRRRIFGSAGSLLVIVIGAVTFFRYLGSWHTAYEWAALSPMSVHGAVALMMLGIALSLHIWREELGRDELVFLFWGVVLPLAGIGVAQIYLGDWEGPFRTPLTVIETIGAVSAIALAALFHTLWRREQVWHRIIPATAALMIGVLSLLYALCSDNNLSVWLYTLANAAGGLTMALCWMPAHYREALNRHTFYRAAGLIALVAGLTSILWDGALPAMVVDGHFTRTAGLLNLGAGLGFFAAAARFLSVYRNQPAHHLYVVILLCLLFGASGVLFQASVMWDAAWWTWHMLRFAAFIMALSFVFVHMQRREVQLYQTHQQLEMKLAELEKTKAALEETGQQLQLALTSANMGVWQWDLHTGCLDLDEHVQQLVGFRPGAFTGRFEELLARIKAGDRARLEAGENTAFAPENVTNTQFDVVLPDGTTRNLATRGTVYRDCENTAARMVGVCWDQTATRAAERALQVSEQRLQAILDNSATLISLKDLEGRYVLVNRRFAQVCGKDADAIVGHCDTEVWAEEQAAQIRRHDLRTLEADAPQTFEEAVPGPDGLHTHYCVKFPLRDAAGAVEGLACIATDITPRKQMEEVLREREIHFRSLMEQAADPQFLMDENGRFTRVNARACDALGYTSDELLAMAPWDIDTQYSREQVLAQLARTRGGNPITVEGMHRRKDGATFPVEVRIGCIQIDARITFMATARDITERHRADAALRASEFRFRTLTNTVPCAIFRCACDNDWTMKFVSNQITGITGYPSHEFINSAVRSYASIIVPEDRARVRQTVHDAIAEDAPWSVDYRIRHADGVFRWVYEEGRAVFEGTGTVRYLDGFILDQTARKEAEDALREQTSELQRLVAELNRINDELDQFAYVASHDLQEPLRTLTTYSGFLEEDLGDDLSSDVREDLCLLMNAAERMRALVRDLLAFSRSGRVALDRKKISLDTCVDDALGNLQTLLDDTGAEVLRVPLAYAKSDRTLITQVFQNLISNALKFRSATRPRVEITFEQANGRAIYGVRDNGIGIDPAYREQIFAPFKRLHTTREYTGSGIGLAVCRRVIERHGGTIWVESEPGAGAHFRFTLSTWKGTQYGGAEQARSTDPARRG
ncbi:MAG: PAS domain S-box protein [Candidatus Hydrogenedentota bacterium]